MKKIISHFVLILVCLFGCIQIAPQLDAATANNISIGGGVGSESSNVKQNDKLQDFNERGQFIEVSVGGEKGVYNTLVRIARDIKNLFYAIATVYFLVICLKLIFASNTEEELGKFKKGIIWITVGIIVMQLAFAFTKILFDQGISARLGVNLLEYMVWPMIALLQTLASVFFIAMAIYAFYRLITANGEEEAVKSGKTTIVYALVGFVFVKLTRSIVEAFYGSINCETFSLGFITINGDNCINRLDISEGASILISIINWLNGFVAIVVVIMIMYAGAQILLSGGDEEKVKKGKSAILYIAIGLGLLITNYLILTFFLIPETAI